MQKADTALAVTVRGSVETSRGARGTHPRIFERHQSGDTVAAHNYFHQVRRAQVFHVMLLEIKSPTVAPHWKDVETLNMFELSARYLRLVDNQSKTGK